MEKTRGFTLIELIIVLALMTVISQIVIFSPSVFNDKILHKTTDMLVADLRYIQQMSIISGKGYKLQFLKSAEEDVIRKYSIYDGSATYDEPLKTVTFPNGIEIVDINIPEEYANTIEYKPRGTLSYGSCTIVFKIGSARQDVTILPATGRVKIINY